MRLIRSLEPASLAPSEIERVIITRPATDYDAPGICAEPPYHNTNLTLMSAKFTSIATLLGKPVSETSYFKESFGDAEVEEVAHKTTLPTRAMRLSPSKSYARMAERSPSDLQKWPIWVGT